AFLSAMGQREAIAFGDGVATTMRMKFEKLPNELLPGAKDDGPELRRRTESIDDVDLASIVERMRNSGRRSRPVASIFTAGGTTSLGSVHDEARQEASGAAAARHGR